MEFFGKFRHRVAAFTLVELLVTVAIVGVLATIAIGQYDQLKVIAHRAEAKNALGYIGKLQEAYRIEHNGYYAPTTDTMDGTNKYGGTKGGPAPTNECNGNRLGFKLKGCSANEVRFQYYLQNTSANGWVAVAHVPAANVAARLGLACDTAPSTTIVTTPGHTEYTHATSGTGVTLANSNFTAAGDAHYVTDRRGALVHVHDVLQDCD